MLAGDPAYVGDVDAELLHSREHRVAELVLRHPRDQGGAGAGGGRGGGGVQCVAGEPDRQLGPVVQGAVCGQLHQRLADHDDVERAAHHGCIVPSCSRSTGRYAGRYG